MSDWKVERLSPALGASVEGPDLTAPLECSTIEQLTELLCEYLVLALPGQSLEPEDHVALGRHFGEPLLHPFLTAIDGHPEILRVVKEPGESETFGGEYWHADITFMNPPASVSLLQSLELPPSGGDTFFSNQYMALDALDAGTRNEIEDLNGVHLYPGHNADDPHSVAIHPVVRTHKLTGRQALFVNPAFVVRFEGQTQAQSKPLLDKLFKHQVCSEFLGSVVWSDPMLTMWDNRAVLHYATNDYFGHRRSLQRVTAMER